VIRNRQIKEEVSKEKKGPRQGGLPKLSESVPKTVALYARVSTKEQNLETQLAPLREHAERAGWEVHREYTDLGYSGQKQRRPGLDALMQDAKARKFNALLVVKLDRLGRSLSHLVRLLDDLRALSIDFVATSQAIDTTTPTGKLMLGMLGAIAEFERELIRERVMAGLERAKREGKILGRPPKLDAEQVVELRAAGMSLRQIANALGVSKSAVAYQIGRIEQAEPA
jgi:DNA invertase Pin-like site-specific DNA recombinase